MLGEETGGTGELVIVGPQLADGYWNDPEIEDVAAAIRSLGWAQVVV